MTQTEIPTLTSKSLTDVLSILQFDAGLRDGSNDIPPPTGRLYVPACDVSGDAICGIVDAMVVLQCVVNVANELCPADDGTTTLIPPTGGNDSSISATIRVGAVPAGSADPVIIRVIASAPQGLAAVTVDLAYDPAALQVLGCTADPDDHFGEQICNVDYGEIDGNRIIRLSAVGTQMLTGELALAEITVQATDGSSTNGQLSVESMLISDSAGGLLDVEKEEEGGKAEQRLYLPLTR